MITRILRYFIQGLLFIAPSFITIYIVYLVFTYTDKTIQHLFSSYLSISIPGMGIVVLLLLITTLGFLGQSIFFRPLRKLLDNMLIRAPFVKVLYSAIRDLLSAFVGNERKFNRPVLVKVNAVSELEKIGFLTSDDLSELHIKDKVAVYFPHSYNFSGEMFIVPRENITPLNIPAAEVMKFIVSGGVTKV